MTPNDLEPTDNPKEPNPSTLGEEPMPDMPPPPLTVKDDGNPYRYEMLYAGLAQRAYADTTSELVSALIPGYLTLGDVDQWEARLQLATTAQVALQALYLVDAPSRLPEWQREILDGPRHEPPTVANWDCPVPLVLISSYYQPAGDIPKPVREQGMPANVLWIDPSDDTTFLTSLHELGYIGLNIAD